METVKCVLSLDWSTNTATDPEHGYTEIDTKLMNDTVFKNVPKNMEESLNFPIRALYAVKNHTILKNFLDNMQKNINPKATYTIWSAKEDKFDGAEVTNFVNLIGTSNVYLSLSDELLKQVHLRNGASSLIQFGLLNLATLVVVTIFRNGLH